jgi:hypothetical protein
VREVVRRRGGVGLEPVAVPVSAGSAVAASSAFAEPVTVSVTAAPVLGPGSVLAPVLAPASAEDEGSLRAEIGAFLPLGYP